MEHERQITAERLADFADQLRREERAAGTEENYLRHVRAFAGWLGGRPVTREGAAAAVNVRDSQYTTGYLESLGDAAYCSVHTTAPEPEPSAPLVIDPYNPATWPGPEAFATIEDFNRFNPFDQSTWPEGAVSVSEEPPAASTPGLPTEPPAPETPVSTPLPSEAVSPSSPPAVVTPPVFSEEPFLPAA